MVSIQSHPQLVKEHVIAFYFILDFYEFHFADFAVRNVMFLDSLILIVGIFLSYFLSYLICILIPNLYFVIFISILINFQYLTKIRKS